MQFERGNVSMGLPRGKVLTARGSVDPSELGRALMHEHLHCDIYDWKKMKLITEEKPMTAQRREFMFREAIPLLHKCADDGCHAFVEASPSPWRAWPTFYAEASKAANVRIVLCTGFYREVEVGKYWVKTEEDAIWPFVRKASVDELADFCTREIQEGIHGTGVHAGAIKLASSQPKMTEAEEKNLRRWGSGAEADGSPHHHPLHQLRGGDESAAALSGRGGGP